MSQVIGVPQNHPNFDYVTSNTRWYTDVYGFLGVGHVRVSNCRSLKPMVMTGDPPFYDPARAQKNGDECGYFTSNKCELMGCTVNGPPCGLI